MVVRRFGWLAPVLVLAAIWAPVWFHYRIPRPSISTELIEQARATPPDSVLAELERARFSARRWSEQPDLVPIAERLLAGVADIPGYGAVPVKLPFDPGDIQTGLPGWQLELASLVLPEILLTAYESTGQDSFLVSARDAILGWASYERRAVGPRGFLWNDHAVASRVVVLAHFWRLYRHHPLYDPHVARPVLEFAARSGHLLADPSHFTFATNHGVMQNLALMHLAIAFPWMPERESWRHVAARRLEGQMGFYVDAQGVVLEHSAGYQAFGLELLGMALRYRTLLADAIPPTWVHKYEAATKVYSLLRRPDASLPLIGDTDGRSEVFVPDVTAVDEEGRAGPLRPRGEWSRPAGDRLLANAGYAIWWDEPARDGGAEDRCQTVVAWSNVPGHGHKHADELSVQLWGRGASWWSNVGYWRYGVPGRDEAVSWPGSNAPHLVGEPGSSHREVHLLGSHEGGGISMVDLERRGPDAYRARRQVVHVPPDLWIILDQTQGREGDRTTTTWTASPDVTLLAGKEPGTYLLTSEGSRFELRASIQGSPAAVPRLLRGALEPFGGWVVRHGVPEPATSIVVEQPARNAWTVAAWRMAPAPTGSREGVSAGAGAGSDSGVRVRHEGPENWEVSLSPWLGSTSIRRDGTRVSVKTGAEPERAVTLVATPRDSTEIKAIEDAFQTMAREYPRFRDYVPERLRLTVLIAAAFFLFELLCFALRRRRPGLERSLRYAAPLGWIAVGLWMVGIYLRA